MKAYPIRQNCLRIAAYQLIIDKQRAKIEELETQIRDLETAALLLPVEGETS